MNNFSNADIINTLYKYEPPTWASRISPGSRDYWTAAKQIISAENYQPVMNEIYKDLVNRIALTIITPNKTTNPLSIFKRGRIEFGDVIQELNTDVISEEKFEGGEPDQFKKSKAPVTAAYSRINRESVYTTTIEDPRLRRAFIEAGGLNALLTELVAMLRKSNTVDEYIFSKRLITDTYTNTDIPVQKTQTIFVPDLSSPDASKEEINKFIFLVKKTMRRFPFNSRNFTASRAMQSTNPSDMAMFLHVDYITINEINNLSSAFSPEYLNLNVPMIGMDDFGVDEQGNPTNNIVGVICDNRAFDIYDTLNQATVSQNAKGLYQNHFLHIHQLYKASAYRNIVWLVKQTSKKGK